MEYQFEGEICSLVEEFECAYLMALETVEQIESYVDKYYGGDTETFLFCLSHSCDYFSLSPVIRDFITLKEKNNS